MSEDVEGVTDLPVTSGVVIRLSHLQRTPCCASHNECQKAACECDLETVRKFKDTEVIGKQLSFHGGDTKSLACVEKQNLLSFEAGCCGFGLKWLLYNEASPYLQCLLDGDGVPLVQNVLNNFVVKTYKYFEL